jgi:hypothetical protein
MSLRSSNAVHSPALNRHSPSAILLALGLLLSNRAARSAPLLPGPPASNTDAKMEQVRAVVRGGRAVVGPHGNVALGRTTVVHPSWHGGGVRWARPGRYRRPSVERSPRVPRSAS